MKWARRWYSFEGFVMDRLDIILPGDRMVFAPRETVAGRLEWALEANPRCLELSLFWYTAGKGTRDVGVVETARLDAPGAYGAKDFSFHLPEGPYSFSGRLISLLWALEVTCTPGSAMVRREITVSPTGREIALRVVDGQDESRAKGALQ
jgi:hypothetical protein